MADSITLKSAQNSGTVTLVANNQTILLQGKAQGPQGIQGPQGDPATNLVTSVAGRQGVVTLDKTDVGLSNVDNTSDANKPISTATKSYVDTADALKVSKAGDTMTGQLKVDLSADPSNGGIRVEQFGNGASHGIRVVNAAITSGANMHWNDNANFFIRSDAALNIAGASNRTTINGIDHVTGTGFPEGVVTAPVGSIYIDTAVTNGASSWIKKIGTGNTGWKVLEGDTGWRDMQAEFESICTANSLTFSVAPGFLSPKIRRVGDLLLLDVGVNITGTGSYNIDFRSAFGQNLNGFKGGPSNRQIPASVTGSAGVIHWAPNYYVKFWSPGLQTLNVVWPITDTAVWPTTLPGTAA